MTDKIKISKNSDDQVCTGGSDRCLRGTVTDFTSGSTKSFAAVEKK